MDREELDLPPLTSIEIPDKRQFKIGEVAKLLDLEPHTLRFWEQEFEVLAPQKTDSGQRAYQRGDIELLATIRELLYEVMFTIDGARRQLELCWKGEPSYLSQTMIGADAELREQITTLQSELEEARQAADEAAEGDTAAVEEWKRTAEQLQSENEALQKELHQVRQKVEQLRSERDRARRKAKQADQQPGVDPSVLESLHRELDALAKLSS